MSFEQPSLKTVDKKPQYSSEYDGSRSLEALFVKNEKVPQKYLDSIFRFISDKENLIGFGGAAEVFQFDDSGLCIKVMKNRHALPDSDRYDLGNSAEEESAFLCRLSKFKVSGARSPFFVECLYSEIHAAIVMEKLNAINVHRVISGDERLPDNFSLNVFFDSLEDYIHKMHSNKGISHGDLYARNIMIDRSTGLPYIIDFGCASFLENDKDRKNKEKFDWQCLEGIWNELDNFIDKNK